MNRYTIIALLLLTLTACKQHPGEGYSQDIEDKIHEVETHLGASPAAGETWTLAGRMKFYDVEGLSIAVVHNNRVEWARGYGWADVAARRPVTPATLFQAGSISKSLNAVGVLLLVQDHRLDLNEDINHYLRSWKFPYDSVSKGRRITVGMLLSHTGGLSVHGFPGYEQHDTIPSLVDVLDGRRPANTPAVRSIAEPGTRYIYSGGGVTISQLILTDLTHIPYDRLMSDSVLQPMGMTSSSYTQPPPASNDRATGYLSGDEAVPGKFHIYPEQAAAGLWTTPTDIGKYIVESQLAYAGKSSKVLDEATTRIRLSPFNDSIKAGGNTKTGLGVFLFQSGNYHYFCHNGSDVGFLSVYFGCLETGDGVAVMINSDTKYSLLREVVNSVATAYHWEGFKQAF